MCGKTGFSSKGQIYFDHTRHPLSAHQLWDDDYNVKKDEDIDEDSDEV